jgi:8-oxo-dGTP pyrophosphatase MutT (NUDIX family)
MSTGVRNGPDSGLTVVRSSARTRQPSADFVRLSHLRKLCECEQVAAVCYRVRSSGIEFLLVQTRGSGRWTFPKGSAEPGLTHAQAAALEAFEEAGVHGRIEELSFTRYIRRKRGDARNSAARSAKQPAINAHLCEVLRLSPAQESKRNRTWFSAEDARRRLREGRNSDDWAEFTRVVDKAVARIQRSRAETGMVDVHPQDDPPRYDRPRQDRPRQEALQKDALRKVQFDFAEAYGRVAEASYMPYVRRGLGGIRRFGVPIVDAHPREVLRGEVLQFGSPRGFSGVKKVKALGTGTRNG